MLGLPAEKLFEHPKIALISNLPSVRIIRRRCGVDFIRRQIRGFKAYASASDEVREFRALAEKSRQRLREGIYVCAEIR